MKCLQIVSHQVGSSNHCLSLCAFIQVWSQGKLIGPEALKCSPLRWQIGSVIQSLCVGKVFEQTVFEQELLEGLFFKAYGTEEMRGEIWCGCLCYYIWRAVHFCKVSMGMAFRMLTTYMAFWTTTCSSPVTAFLWCYIHFGVSRIIISHWNKSVWKFYWCLF